MVNPHLFKYVKVTHENLTSKDCVVLRYYVDVPMGALPVNINMADYDVSHPTCGHTIFTKKDTGVIHYELYDKWGIGQFYDVLNKICYLYPEESRYDLFRESPELKRSSDIYMGKTENWE